MSCQLNDRIKIFTNNLIDRYDKIRGKDRSCLDVPFWDVVVITTADGDQKTVFEKQIKDKLERCELPTNLPFHIINDPAGPKIGNGGSTLTAIEFLYKNYEDKLYTHKVLLIHAGGQSQRMPSASVLGKVFSPIPRGDPIYQMLDMKLAMFLPLIPQIKSGIFVTCADDFLTYDLGDEASQDSCVKFSDHGFTVLAHPSPVSVGTTHGVYVLNDAELVDPSKAVQRFDCLEVLQKPTESLMKEKGAIVEVAGNGGVGDGQKKERIAYTDSSFFFAHDVTQKLLGFITDTGMVKCEIDAYGDFLQSLGQNASPAYVQNTANVSTVTPDLIETRTKIFNLLQGTQISVLVMNRSKFIHTGTTLEYIKYFCNDNVFQDELGLLKDVFNLWTMEECEENGAGEPHQKKVKVTDLSDTSLGCVMHSVLPLASNIHVNTVVEYCHFTVPVNIGQYCIVSNCEYIPENNQSTSKIDKPLVIPYNLFLHTVPIKIEGITKYVTVFFDIKDNLKKVAPDNNLAKLPFLGQLVEDYIAVTRIDLENVEPKSLEKGASKQNLWHARLFPVCRTMTEALDHALKCVDALKTENHDLISLKGYEMVSMHLILQLKDVDSMLKQRNSVYQKIKNS